MKAALTGWMILALALEAAAQSSSTSASYALLHAPAGSIGGGGPISGGGGITAQVATGDAVSGIVSNVTGLGTQAKGNLVGQLYDVAVVEVSASPATVNEGATLQMTPAITLDDATFLSVPASDLLWSETGAFLSGIDTSGLVTVASVYQNEPGQYVGGSYLGVADPDGFHLTVLNVGADDFGLYAGDGIDDDWQVGFFGVENADGIATANPDKDRDTNLDEFLSGFDPTDAASLFQFTMTGISGSTASFQLNKAIPGRTYRLKESGDLTGSFTEIDSFSVATEETGKVIQDAAAPADRNFYRLEISRP